MTHHYDNRCPSQALVLPLTVRFLRLDKLCLTCSIPTTITKILLFLISPPRHFTLHASFHKGKRRWMLYNQTEPNRTEPNWTEPTSVLSHIIFYFIHTRRSSHSLILLLKRATHPLKYYDYYIPVVVYIYQKRSSFFIFSIYVHDIASIRLNKWCTP